VDSLSIDGFQEFCIRRTTKASISPTRQRANARYLEDKLYDMVAQRPELRHVILMCTAVNEIDASALESLEAINQRLDHLGVAFHLSEVKGPVTEQLRKSDFLKHLTGQVFLSQYKAIEALGPELPSQHVWT
jgi:sulfate permease, SulP family